MTHLPKLLLVPAAAVVLAGCAAAPAGPSGSGSPSAAGACARMVTDSGGLDDHSFNQASWEGMQQAQQQYGIDVQAIVSRSDTDLQPNVDQASESGCGFVLTVGYSLAPATEADATSHPDVDYAIVDDNSIDLPNVKPIVFDTDEAAYLAGYAAAGVSKTGKVATYGGDSEPAVTLFMDGFWDGVQHYNEVHGTSVQVLGWDKDDPSKGSFTGDYTDVNKGKVLTEGFIAQGADVIMPVAGQVGEGTLAAAVDHPGTLVVWVDTDGYLIPAYEQYKSVLLTSVMKKMQGAVVDIAGSVLDGSFTNEQYVGTLKNGGVDIAPFHDLESTVGAALSGEVAQLKQDIVDGKITVDSPSSPLHG